MQTKTLRELQLRGEKIVPDSQPLLIENRSGPVAILIPVTAASLPALQAEAEKWMAMESLKKTWSLARDSGLEQFSDEDIAVEIRRARRRRISKR